MLARGNDQLVMGNSSDPIFDSAALRLYAITANGAAKDRSARARIRHWLEAGVRTIQLREKKLPPADIVQFGKFLRAITAEYGALLIVNDDPVLAEMLGADGCHLGWEDMRASEARRLLGESKIIGLSTHNREQIEKAAEMDVDYIGVGPIYATDTKETQYPATGPELAGWAVANAGVPVVAIGGINLGNVALVASAGCTNAAVIAALNRTSRPGEAARAMLDILNSPNPAGLR